MRHFLPSTASALPPLALGLAALLCTAQALGQPVYKCEAGGKVTYQAEPCLAGKASAVKVEAGPPAEVVAEARSRADREKAQAAAITVPAPQRQVQATGRTVGVDCGGLAARREQAFNRRNAGLGQARQGLGVTAGSSGDQAIGNSQVEIVSLESQMRARGCPVN